MRNKLKEALWLFSVRFVAASDCERIIIGYVASVNERKCTIAWTPCTSGSSPTGTRVFIQRAEARTRFARSSRMVSKFGDLTLAPFRLLGKWQIQERQTISPLFMLKELTFESIHTPSKDRFQEEHHWRATILPRQKSLIYDITFALE